MANYTYDAEGHLLTAGGVTYSYDGDGKRVMKSNGKLYWYGAGSEPVIETDAAGNFQYRYLYFAGMRVAREEANDWVDHYINDALGNARIVYGLNGGWDWSDYYPFGGERVVNGNTLAGNHFKFTGKERDTESGLDDFEARYYSSSMGRFMSADWSAIPVPVPYANLTNPQTLNLYAIVHDNPITFADLDGHCVNSPTGSFCAPQAGADAGANPGGQKPQSPYQKYIEQENRPPSDQDRFNAAKTGTEMAAPGVNAAVVVAAVEAAPLVAAIAVEVAPAVAANVQAAGAAANTGSLSLYVRATTALASAGTAIGNTYRAGVDLARQAVVTVDTLRSGGGAIRAAGDVVQGASSSIRVPNNPFGWTGRAARVIYDLVSK